MEPRHGIIRTALNAEAHGIRADLVHLTNIVNTLLDNAEKYSAGPPDITITTFNRNDTIVVRIEDKGIGIPSEHLKRVFEKYYRVPSGNLHDVKGFGLGLSYARLMATAHGGSIRLESSPGHGTSVDLTLPLVDQHR
jgi:two-component system phosphate regulon sensor histidine kinase PhoR